MCEYFEDVTGKKVPSLFELILDVCCIPVNIANKMSKMSERIPIRIKISKRGKWYERNR